MSTRRIGQTTLSLLTSFLPILIGLYAVAMTCSMSGMEILSWSTVIFLILAIVVNKLSGAGQFKPHTTGMEIPLLGLVLAVFLSLKLNAPDANFTYAFGSLRNLALIYFFCYAFQMAGNLNRYFWTLVISAFVVSIYGIYQHYTGADLWHQFIGKPSPIDVMAGGEVNRYNVIGLFGHHLTFAHSYMMIVTIPWAALLLSKRQTWWARLGFLLVTAVILTAIVFTFGRGAWIGLLIALTLMALFVSRKLFFTVFVSLAIVGFVSYKLDYNIRSRFWSFFDATHYSNEDRRKLWSINMEMFRDHPWIGVGYRQNEELSQPYYQKLGIENGMSGHAHNNYIQMLSTTGIMGFSFYMLMILGFLLMTMRLISAIPNTHYWHKVLALAALGSQVAFHVGGLTQWNFGDAEVNHLYIFWLATVSYMNERYQTSIVPDDRAL